MDGGKKRGDTAYMIQVDNMRGEGVVRNKVLDSNDAAMSSFVHNMPQMTTYKFPRETAKVKQTRGYGGKTYKLGKRERVVKCLVCVHVLHFNQQDASKLLPQ